MCLISFSSGNILLSRKVRSLRPRRRSHKHTFQPQEESRLQAEGMIIMDLVLQLLTRVTVMGPQAGKSGKVSF